jgi:polyphosphate glucokinase
MTTILGIDIGGTGIKGAPVDLEAGALAGDRFRIPTPEGGSPGDVAKVVGEIVANFETTGPIGCTFPAVMQRGVALTASNVDTSWIGTDAQALFESAVPGRPFVVINDADAAGIAEIEHGAGKGKPGTVMIITLGTGIGSALFTDGVLVPNTEFGHLDIRGKAAEVRASENVREAKDLSWEKWTKRLNEVLAHIEALLCPDLFIIGGGISKKSAKFLPLLKTRAEIVPALLLNQAGIVGAAIGASRAVVAP